MWEFVFTASPNTTFWFALTGDVTFNGTGRLPRVPRRVALPAEEDPAIATPQSMNWWTQQKLQSRFAGVRLSAVEQVAAREGPEASKYLAPLVTDPDLEVRRAVVYALTGSRDKVAVNALVEALRDADREIRWRAAKALEGAGWQPTSDEQNVWRAVAQGEFVKAADYGSVAVEPLIAELADLNSPSRRDVINSLGQLGDSRAIGPLLAAVNDTDPNIRVAAVDALNGVRDMEVIAGLIGALKDAVSYVRAVAAAGLGKAGDPSAVEPLMAVLTDDDWEVRKAASDALGRLRDKRAAVPLSSLLNDTDQDVREAAVNALGEIRDRSAVEALVKSLTDLQLSVRNLAAGALRKIDAQWEKLEEAQAAVPMLRIALRSSDYWVRQAATEVLGKLDKEFTSAPQPGETDSVILVRQQVALGILVKALQDENPILRLAAAEALGRSADPRLVSPLVPGMGDADRWVRRAAALALDKLGWKPADDAEKARHQAALEAGP